MFFQRTCCFTNMPSFPYRLMKLGFLLRRQILSPSPWQRRATLCAACHSLQLTVSNSSTSPRAPFSKEQGNPFSSRHCPTQQGLAPACRSCKPAPRDLGEFPGNPKPRQEVEHLWDRDRDAAKPQIANLFRHSSRPSQGGWITDSCSGQGKQGGGRAHKQLLFGRSYRSNGKGEHFWPLSSFLLKTEPSTATRKTSSNQLLMILLPRTTSQLFCPLKNHFGKMFLEWIYPNVNHCGHSRELMTNTCESLVKKIKEAI